MLSDKGPIVSGFSALYGDGGLPKSAVLAAHRVH